MREPAQEQGWETSEILFPTADVIKTQAYQSMDERHIKPAGHQVLANTLRDAYKVREDEELITTALHHYAAAIRGVKPGSLNEANLRQGRLLLYLHEYDKGRVSSDVLLGEIEETTEIVSGVRTRKKAERRAYLLGWLAEIHEYVRTTGHDEVAPSPALEARPLGVVATESFLLSIPEPS